MRTLITIAALWAVPAVVIAAGGEEGEAHGKQLLIYAVINFTIFVALLTYILRKPLREFLGRREKELTVELERVRNARAEYEQRIAKLQARVDGLDEEHREIVEEATTAAQHEAERIRESASEMAASIQSGTEARIDALGREVRAGIVEEILQELLTRAGEQLATTVDAERDQKLVADRIKALEASS